MANTNVGRRSMRGHTPLLTVLGMASLLVVGASSCYAADVTVKVDFGTQLGTPTHRATGWIYGLSEDGTQPAQSFQSDIKAQFFRAGGAQLGCPNSGWANGGYSGYSRRWNSVKAYYQRAKAVGATFVLLPHDLWGADLVCSVPVWPGDNGDWTNFNNFIDQIVKDVVSSGMTGRDVQWDIWNEPDCCGFWEGHRNQGQYLEMWKRAYQRIRAAIPNSVIVGPSTSGQPSPGWGWFTTYLDYVKANNVVPDYISWHELNTGSDPVNSKNKVSSMLSARGMSVRGYQVNEYGSPSEQTTGDSAWYIARLERAGIDGARANWGMYGGLYDTMGELVVNAGGYKPLGAWWVYKRYAEMTGTHIGVTGASSVDGVAAADATTKKAIVVLGSRNNSGQVTVNVSNIPSYLVANGQAHVLLERMPETNGAPVSAPTVVLNENLTLNNTQLSVPISWSNSSDAYVLTLTSGNNSMPPPTPGPDVGVSVSAAGGNGRVDLNWTTTDNLRAVQVMRDTDANPAGRQRVAILGGKVRSFTDTTVTNGRQYWYWIKHTNTSGVTANSVSATATPRGNSPQPIAVSGVSVSPTNSTVVAGSTTTLSATVAPSNASNKSVSWSTSNAGVATVSANGVVTGVAAGNATVTARTADGGRTAASSVTVTAKPDPIVNYTLTIGVSGNGSTNLTGRHSYKSGTAVTVTATPAGGSVFSGWSGAFTGNTNPLTVTMNGNKSLTAMFSAQNDSGNDGDPVPVGDTPPEQTVRVFWVHPSDVPVDTVHPEGIAKVMKEVQRYYKQELGKTFKLNDPVVEVVAGQRPRSYYENTPQWGEKYWYSVANMQIELRDRFKLDAPDNRWILVGEISAEGDGAGGGANSGWVFLSQHDADGAAGIGGTMERWYGGMAHELGHALGLPDSTYTDGTPMSASFYGYPNTHFSQEQKDRILNGPYGSFLH